ncbi:MAG TPA: glycosyl hydrolase 53 family protein [Polyangiaceae bacterium]|nr:glycosyl hydrolase 53 family protein [Polyangiaceae bacterium]
MLSGAALACAPSHTDSNADAPGSAGGVGSGDDTGGTADGGAPTAGSGGSSSGGGAPVGGTGGSGEQPLPAFLLGADVTITLEDEHWGATYTDTDGQKRALEDVLGHHGFNFVRIDTFVNPGAPGGYSATMPESFRDLAHTIELAQRAKAQGLGFFLDLHLSDTWTNPGAQALPAAWTGLSAGALEQAVYDYVHDTLSALRDAGAAPELVQIGNEVTAGFLWEPGRIANNDFTGFARYVKAGIRAARDYSPTLRVVLHIERCNDLAASRWWLNGVLAQGVEFDVLGQSCYAPLRDAQQNVVHPGDQGEPSSWATVFSTLATEYPALDFLIAEYSSEQRAAADVMRALPNGRGLGTFNWDPTRGYATHPNEPLFSAGTAWNDYRAIAARMSRYDQMADDFGLR